MRGSGGSSMETKRAKGSREQGEESSELWGKIRGKSGKWRGFLRGNLLGLGERV
jgi:hypothetical protein